LVKLFADRQLAVDEGLVAYLATRLERSFASATAAASSTVPNPARGQHNRMFDLKQFEETSVGPHSRASYRQPADQPPST
jgi:hypothetical protein